MTEHNEETVPQRARRKGRDYAETYHDRWSNEGRKWIKFAFTKGYQGACEDLADAIDAAVDDSVPGDYDALVDALDALLDRYDGRVAA